MSMSGDSLADWQTIVKALNERIQAMGRFASSALTQIPVPTSKDHITQAFIETLGKSGVASLLIWNPYFWCDPDRPLVITHPGDPGWNGNYQTGNYIYGPSRWVPFQVYPYQYNGDFDTRSIYDSVPSFGSIPLRGSELEKLGDFLGWCNSTLELLTKTASHDLYSLPTIGASAYFRWTQADGEIWNPADYTAPVGNASTFADFYAFALANMTSVSTTGNPSCKVQAYNDSTYIWLTLEYYSSQIVYGYGTGNTLSNPGMIPADVTIYYSSFGDNCGYPVNSSSTHIDYSTVTFQNIGPETPINFGFDASSVSTVPAMPSAGDTYTKQESLQEISAVWDFSNHFQYCV